MADLKLIPNENGDLDIDFKDNDFVVDDGLETSMMISILKYLYNTETAENGWFAESVFLTDFPKGSRIDQLFKLNINENTINITRQYLTEATNWYITEGVADTVEISVSRLNTNGIYFKIVLIRPNFDENESFEFSLNWDAQTIIQL